METDTNLISKREILTEYGISYGALYRWKRMGLIPEDWFLKRATVTGQETFFPEALIRERIEKILASKDEQSLRDMARELAGQGAAEPTLRIETVYGVRRFRLRDIQKLVYIDSTGRETDLTEQLKEK